MRRFAVAATAGLTLLLPACSAVEDESDQLQVVDDPVPATPAPSPEQSQEPAGTVVETTKAVTDVAIDGDTDSLAVAVTGDDAHEDSAVLFYPLDAVTNGQEESQGFAMPGTVESLVPSDGAMLATVPAEDELVRISPTDGVIDRMTISGAPAGVAEQSDTQLVATREHAAVDLFEEGERVGSLTDEISSADRVLAVGDAAVVLDRVRSALFEVDVADEDIGLGVRAGQGATNAVTDRFDRVLVTDTRSDGLLAFSVDPLMLVQRYPVPGGAYGIAYDEERDIAWVTLTERNEVVGFDVAGGEPEEIHRFDSVTQPNSVTVDAQDGRVVVASAAGEGIQVVKP